MPFTSDPGAYSPPPHICQSGICGYITHWPFLGERPWLRENECDGEDLKQCKQHLCFLVVMAPALAGTALFRQIKPVALAEVAHCIEWCVIQHHNPGAVFDSAALRVRVARVFVQRVAVAQQSAFGAVWVGHVALLEISRAHIGKPY